MIEALTKSEAKAKYPQLHRVSLLKSWKKSSDDAPVIVCTHEKIVPWNCGCTFGCDVCGYSAECKECNNILHHNKGIYTPSVWLA